ncbi:SH3 domain-containing protein [Streptomyces sp. DT24]|uniref:SH3 domain-containing protein n=1 Tax=unclassified Streptomyces TaxID=2593676 RepID=UPI0023B9930A|nr:SH3 domain-containing protein [Streptomyces sp. AM 4-1-1]WEH35856.1 SH3 domain-containing protein [Streptomyces sp. AM 4-1-1]
MSSRTLFGRLGLCIATGTLAALTAATPALAAAPAPEPAPQSGVQSAPEQQSEANAAVYFNGYVPLSPSAEDARHDYLGRVIARTGLLLRDRPTRSSRVVGQVPYGAVVHIFCKTTGDNVDGNNRWYLLTDGTWAWGSARYIENIGPAPRTC